LIDDEERPTSISAAKEVLTISRLRFTFPKVAVEETLLDFFRLDPVKEDFLFIAFVPLKLPRRHARITVSTVSHSVNEAAE